jgi:hypothetical protein
VQAAFKASDSVRLNAFESTCRLTSGTGAAKAATKLERPAAPQLAAFPVFNNGLPGVTTMLIISFIFLLNEFVANQKGSSQSIFLHSSRLG